MVWKEKLFGEKDFYKRVSLLALPVLLQNGVTSIVNLLDNVMVGRLGTDAVSAVSIIGQFFFVFTVFLFGGVSGASIFGAQFHGKGDTEGLRYTFRFRVYLCALLTLLAMLLLFLCDDGLISLYLHESGSGAGSVAQTLRLGKSYLRILLWGFPPFALSTCYASILRDMGYTRVPMRAAVIAVLVNLCFNYVLIFGHLGFPALGVEGAAVATVISRYVECVLVVLWTHRNAHLCPFIRGAFASLHIPASLMRGIMRMGLPLLANEILWATGTAMLAQCYSVRGLDGVAAYSIANTVINLFNISFIALGSSVAIIVGNLLGAGKIEEARRADTHLIVFCVLVTAFFSVLMACFAPFFPLLYNAEADVRLLARDLIWISAVFMPPNAFTYAAYYTLRSGGRTGVTFLFDSGFMYAVLIPVAFVLSRFTVLPLRMLYTLVRMAELSKCILGYGMLKNGRWAVNLVGGES